jgi:hypothetical protein
MKDRDSERKGSCTKRRKEKKHAQIKELKDWAFSFLSYFLNFLAIILYFIPKSYFGHNIQLLLLFRLVVWSSCFFKHSFLLHSFCIRLD